MKRWVSWLLALCMAMTLCAAAGAEGAKIVFTNPAEDGIVMDIAYKGEDEENRYLFTYQENQIDIEEYEFMFMAPSGREFGRTEVEASGTCEVSLALRESLLEEKGKYRFIINVPTADGESVETYERTFWIAEESGENNSEAYLQILNVFRKQAMSFTREGIVKGVPVRLSVGQDRGLPNAAALDAGVSKSILELENQGTATAALMAIATVTGIAGCDYQYAELVHAILDNTGKGAVVETTWGNYAEDKIIYMNPLFYIEENGRIVDDKVYMTVAMKPNNILFNDDGEVLTWLVSDTEDVIELMRIMMENRTVQEQNEFDRNVFYGDVALAFAEKEEIEAAFDDWLIRHGCADLVEQKNALSAQAAEEWAARSIGTVTIQSSGTVNLRAGGSTEYEVVAKAKNGDTFEAISQAETGWYEIMLENGSTAFVSPKMVKFTAN